MPNQHVDVAVIGLGSAGEALSAALARSGRSVVGFEPNLIGGECPFTACMPSKVLLHHASLSAPDWESARRHRDDVVNHLDDTGHHEELIEAGVTVVRERAHLDGERMVGAGENTWTADLVVLATGSAPVVPAIDGLDQERIWTSDDLMTAPTLPGSCVLVGGGVIGCESAAILAGFGTAVTLVEGEDHLLAGAVAPEVGELLGERLADLGVDVRTGNDVEAIEHRDGDDEVRIAGGEAVSGACVLVAIGQAPVWDGVGLERVGLDGRPDVDDDYVVGGLGWLRAIGDVDGRSPWTHAANHEAARLVELLTADDARPEVPNMPNCVFTDPPIGAVGLTAAQARDAGHEVICGTARYSDIARYVTDQTFDGMVVVVADRDTGELLGCSGIGPRFDDTVSVVAALMRGGITVEEAAQHIIPFPTMSQVLTPAFQAVADQR